MPFIEFEFELEFALAPLWRSK